MTGDSAGSAAAKLRDGHQIHELSNAEWAAVRREYRAQLIEALVARRRHT